jgi:hypothetical protein
MTKFGSWGVGAVEWVEGDYDIYIFYTSMNMTVGGSFLFFCFLTGKVHNHTLPFDDDEAGGGGSFPVKP